MKKLNNFAELEKYRESLKTKKKSDQVLVAVCGGSGCLALGGEKVADALRKELKAAAKKNGKVELILTGCHGFCEKGPLVVFHPQGIFYNRVKPEDAEELVAETVLKKKLVDRLLYQDPVTQEKIIKEEEVPFYKNQKRIIFGSNGLIDPTSIEDYLLIDGYAALAKALTLKPEEIIQEVEKAGLRGRGGGGFPTALKWRTCRQAPGEPKYAIINADEGDPGAYMDRSILEGNPHSVLEGLIIGAYAIGASQGFIYVRHEYPLALRNFILALDSARKAGLLGENILGTGFNFDVNINQGGGAFVCGESSALMASIEGKRGAPRAKYVHTVERGIYDRPSNLNNVETWANVPTILNRGADWYAGIGTPRSKGTKIFSLVGKVNNTGLVEVPMGISLREIVFNIGGGIPGGKKFKAVQTGGPSGGCIPESMLDLPVDFDQLTQVGSMMGSGGMIVMDESTCMVDLARYFLNFLREESCGKCTPCREGIKQMLIILTRITAGEGREGDVELLEEMSQGIIDASLCALGGSAPNPVLTTIKYFRSEYDAHIRDRKCPAGVCKALITFSILADKCTGCMVCLRNCPSGAVSGKKKEVHTIDSAKCTKCGICFEMCKFKAVLKK